MSDQGVAEVQSKLNDLFPRVDPMANVNLNEIPLEIVAELELGSEWPEPDPLRDSLPEVAQFELDLMPASFRPLVQDVAERMQVPMDFPAVAAIATLAGVTNRRASIQPKRIDDSWIVVPNLWGGIVASPGMLKSPVIASITQPARAIEKEWREAHVSAEQEYARSLELHEEEVKAWRTRFQAASKADKPRPTKPESPLVKPALKRLITSDATFESLHSLLSENSAGLFVLRDELTGWLTQLERQGREQERAFSLECWNGDAAFTIDRIGRGSVHVPHACISLFGGIQPARLRAYLADALRDSDSNDGLIQRFQLIVWPDMHQSWRYVDRKPDQDALEYTARVYRQIANLDAGNPLRLQFDDEAQELFEQWLRDLEVRIREDDLSSSVQAHLAKYRKLMPSLALLFALADERFDSVSLPHACLACDWCDYLESHAQRVYSFQARPEYQAAIVLGGKLVKGWKREEGLLTVRDVYRNGWNMLTTPEAARGALNVLTDYGWVREAGMASERAIGRPSETYLINPRIARKHVSN